MAKALVLYNGTSPTLGEKTVAMRADGVWFSRSYVNKGRYGWGWTKWARCEAPERGTWENWTPEKGTVKGQAELVVKNGVEVWESIEYGFKTMGLTTQGQEHEVRLPND